MTRREFIASVNTWDALMSFVSDIGIGGIFEEVIPAIDISSQIDEDIREALDYDMWTDIRDFLNNLAEVYTGYVRRYDQFDYYQLTDDDIDEYKGYVIEYADRYGCWDEDDDMYDLDDADGSNNSDCDQDKCLFEVSISIDTLFA